MPTGRRRSKAVASNWAAQRVANTTNTQLELGHSRYILSCPALNSFILGQLAPIDLSFIVNELPMMVFPEFLHKGIRGPAGHGAGASKNEGRFVRRFRAQDTATMCLLLFYF